ncbi:MAG TPA: hypothetical protein VMS31_22625 [Pyrinomonadaceae bacterium]|nr:hypothetical protein [Pyrinomonadaceae bacterium]
MKNPIGSTSNVIEAAFRRAAVAEFSPAFQGRGTIAEPPGVSSATRESALSRQSDERRRPFYPALKGQ